MQLPQGGVWPVVPRRSGRSTRATKQKGRSSFIGTFVPVLQELLVCREANNCSISAGSHEMGSFWSFLLLPTESHIAPQAFSSALGLVLCARAIQSSVERPVTFWCLQECCCTVPCSMRCLGAALPVDKPFLILPLSWSSPLDPVHHML